MTNLVIIAAALFVLLLERIPLLRRKDSPIFRSGFASDVVFLLVGYVAGSELAVEYVRSTSDALGAVLPRFEAPLWIAIPIALALLDLGNFLVHLALHRFDALWKLHQVHHSSRHLDWLATFRSHLLEQVLRRLAAPLFLIAIGMPIQATVIAAAILLGWAVFVHANLSVNLRFLEPILITPRLHHLHHVVESCERNFGTVFSVWDRLLGRLELADAGPDAATGVPGEVETYPRGFSAQMLEPFRR